MRVRHVLAGVALAAVSGAVSGTVSRDGPRPRLAQALQVRTAGAQPRPAPAAETPAAPAPDPCPQGSVLVEGDYCPVVEQDCEEWMDPPGRFRRCLHYKRPSKCLAKRRHMRFCIDRGEYVPPGRHLPENHRDFVQAMRICRKAGKRICTESEWNFACEGEQMRPYPYGFDRDTKACNADRMDLADGDGHLRDLRSAPGDYPRCISPFGAYDMAGNLEELVARDRYPGLPALKGAHWLPGRNNCRKRQTIHGPHYSGTEVGFRCCADAR